MLATTPTIVKHCCHSQHQFVLTTLSFALVLLLGCGMVVGLDVGGTYNDGGGNGVEAGATGRTRFGQGSWKGRDGDGNHSMGGDDSSSPPSSESTVGPDYQIYSSLSGNNAGDVIKAGSSSFDWKWSGTTTNANLDAPFDFGNSPQPRIVGGQDAGEDEYDAYVELTIGDSIFGDYCGGSLIAPNIVLTAAHCYTEGAPLYVRVNKWAFASQGDARPADVSRFERHPNFGDGLSSAENDFMLLELATSFPNLTFMALNADDSHPKQGENYVVVGLGVTDSSDASSFPDVLQELIVQLINSDVCNDIFSNFFQVEGLLDEETMFCAAPSGIPEGKNFCEGDSGGPLLYKNNNGGTNDQVLIGVVSFVATTICDQEGYPGVYARVSSAYDWIKGVVCDDWGNTDAPFCDGTPTGTDPSSTPSPSVAPTQLAAPTGMAAPTRAPSTDSDGSEGNGPTAPSTAPSTNDSDGKGSGPTAPATASSRPLRQGGAVFLAWISLLYVMFI